MKSKDILFIIFGFIIASIVCIFFNGVWIFNVNIIDFVNLIATISISIVVLYMARAINKKDIVRDLVVKELASLASLYEQILDVFKKLKSDDITLNEARQEIRMIFHKGDLIIDIIRKELNESFPKFNKKASETNLIEITTPYYKWVTDDDFMNRANFKISADFLKKHETILANTNSSIKMVIHKLIKFI